MDQNASVSELFSEILLRLDESNALLATLD